MERKKNDDLRIRVYDRDHLIAFCEKKDKNSDQKTMRYKFKKLLDIIDRHGVKDYPDFMSFLQKSGFRAPQQKDLICSILNKLVLTPTENITQIEINVRDLKKTDLGKRNIILTAIAIEYPNELVKYIIEYIHDPQKNIKIDDQDKFINKIKKFINCAKKEISVIEERKESNDFNLSSTLFDDKEMDLYDENFLDGDDEEHIMDFMM